MHVITGAHVTHVTGVSGNAEVFPFSMIFALIGLHLAHIWPDTRLLLIPLRTHDRSMKGRLQTLLSPPRHRCVPSDHPGFIRANSHPTLTANSSQPAGQPGQFNQKVDSCYVRCGATTADCYEPGEPSPACKPRPPTTYCPRSCNSSSVGGGQK